MDSQGQAVGEAVPQVEERTLRRAILGASIGNTVEWFDFATYNFLATTLAVVFFPPGNPTAALLSTFAVFAAAFFVRPLGGSSSGLWAIG